MNTPVSPKLDKLLLDMGIDMPVSPTVADVVMWLYEKYGIWIISRKSGSLNKWFYTIYKNDDFIVTKTIHSYDTTHDEFVSNSLTESYEAGIEYTLKNLI